ncbi:TPA: hypothetical protein QEL15_004283 [Stenotrophomonas maltophilia]|nr:hypothetical protein [Stenotrophomonas maltophilia]
MDATEKRARDLLGSIFTCDPAELTRDEVRAARAVLAWQLAQGFVPVPVVPTKQMMDAAVPPSSLDQTGRRQRDVWDAMLAARPEVPS